MTNLRADGLQVFRELLPGVLPDVADDEVDFGGGFAPTWNTLEDNQINGHVKINGYNGFWQGFIRNHVNGTVSFTNNTVLDPDGNEFVTNTIKGSLNCSGNSPAPQVGDSEGEPNVVSGSETGQCAGIQ